MLLEPTTEGLAVSAQEAYEPQLHGVIEMLEKLIDSFIDERTTLEQEEMNARHTFEMLVQANALEFQLHGVIEMLEKLLDTFIDERTTHCAGMLLPTAPYGHEVRMLVPAIIPGVAPSLHHRHSRCTGMLLLTASSGHEARMLAAVIIPGFALSLVVQA